MGENWIFIVGFLLGSLLFGFHGLVLLIAPDRYLPIVQLGRPTKLELLQKRPLDLGRRFAGLCITALTAWMFTRPAILWIMHPKPHPISWGGSPLPFGAARWDLLLLGLFGFGSGLFLMVRPEKSVRVMFWADPKSLQDKTTLTLWIVYTRLFAATLLLQCVLCLGDFIRTLT
jgi:hypothetical protein